jgi:hypothetical protein
METVMKTRYTEAVIEQALIKVRTSFDLSREVVSEAKNRPETAFWCK